MLFTRWSDYSGGQLALAEVDEKFADAYLEQLRARGLVETMPVEGEKATKGVMAQRAEKRLDPVYQDAVQDKLLAYAQRKLIAARHEAFERDAAVVSRELTRRVEREPSQRRTARWGGAR